MFSDASNTGGDHRLDPTGEVAPLWRGGYLDRRYMQTPLVQRYLPKLVSRQAAHRTLQPTPSSVTLIANLRLAVAGRPRFTDLRTGERCEERNMLLAAIPADATNRGACFAVWC